MRITSAVDRTGPSRAELATLVAAVGCGTGLRLWQWALDRSLWFDEATVAIGLLRHPFGHWLGVRDFGQISPPGWLAAVGVTSAAFGPTEMALRLPTLLAAIGYLPALWFLLRQVVGRPAALLGLWMAALSPALIQFSAELKPYGADPLVSVAAMALVLRAGRGGSRSLKESAVIGVLLGLLTWFSLFAGVIIAGCSLGFVATTSARRETFSRVAFPGRLLVTAIPLAAFVVVYVAQYHPEPWLGQYLGRFWVLRFWSGGPPGLPGRIWASLMEVVSPMFFGHGGDLFPGILLLVMAAGARRLIRGTGEGWPLVVGPLAVWAALAVGRWLPVSTRLALFASPCLTAVLAAGWEAAVERSGRAWPRTKKWVAGVAAVWLLAPPISGALRVNLEALTDRPHARPIVAAMRAETGPGDLIYLYARAVPEWFFYTTDWRAPDLNRISRVLAHYYYPDGRTFANAPPGLAAGIARIDLRYPYGSAIEILGTPSGLEQGVGLKSRQSPDSAWAGLEVARMLEGSPACLWLVSFHTTAAERDPIRQALEARGYSTVREIAGPRSRVGRVCQGASRR